MTEPTEKVFDEEVANLTGIGHAIQLDPTDYPQLK